MISCRVIMIGLIGLVVTGAYFFYENRDEKVRIYQEELKELNIQNDRLLLNNKILDKSNEGLKVKQDSLKEVLVNKAKKINELKQKKNERINAIEHYTNDELFLFFARVDTDSTKTEW
ncbi:MAG TPA: hypothetical protein VIN73_11835 [Vicingaceae bacterium]